MDINYYKWLEVKITHGYFKDDVCEVLKLVPFDKTAVALKNYKILLQKKNNVISFYCGTEAEHFDIKTELSGLKELYFQIINTDPLFLNYTETPSLTVPEIFLFQNFEGSSQLQIGETVSEDDLIETTLTDFNTQYQPNCLGILKLDLDLVLNTISEIPSFTIDFKARKVYWQYQIVIPSNRSIGIQLGEVKDKETHSPNDKIYIKNPELKQLINGQEAQVYTSQFPKKLRQQFSENPELTFSYQSNGTVGLTTQPIKLPTPSAENLEMYVTPNGAEAICATTIVYV